MSFIKIQILLLSLFLFHNEGFALNYALTESNKFYGISDDGKIFGNRNQQSVICAALAFKIPFEALSDEKQQENSDNKQDFDAGKIIKTLVSFGVQEKNAENIAQGLDILNTLVSCFNNENKIDNKILKEKVEEIFACFQDKKEPTEKLVEILVIIGLVEPKNTQTTINTIKYFTQQTTLGNFYQNAESFLKTIWNSMNGLLYSKNVNTNDEDQNKTSNVKTPTSPAPTSPEAKK